MRDYFSSFIFVKASYVAYEVINLREVSKTTEKNTYSVLSTIGRKFHGYLLNPVDLWCNQVPELLC